MKNLIMAVLGTTLLVSCSQFMSEFTRAERYALAPVYVSGTNFEVFMLVRSTDLDYDDPRDDPAATRAVYATVGVGSVVYCGTDASGCEQAIRRFIDNPTLAETNRGM